MRFAAIQMNSGADIAANLEQAGGLLRAAARDGAELAVLPENFALMSESRTQRLQAAERDGDGMIQDAIRRLARELGIWVVAGTVPVQSADPGRATATCYVYDAAGNTAGRYDKIHLFDVRVPEAGESFAESAYTAPGSARLTVATPWGRLGIAVCYDLRFPEQFRQMAADGMDLLALPAAFTVPTGRAHWEILLRARAAENLCYVVAAAQVGKHPAGRMTWGHSMIIDPWGRILCDAGQTIGIVAADYDFTALNSLREKFPVLEHRRLHN
ncbi:MAG: carbon-nitrogen hydrolase family protein [Gammaproteobacteria bacterium]|jgi:predicted amidohydrolase